MISMINFGVVSNLLGGKGYVVSERNIIDLYNCVMGLFLVVGDLFDDMFLNVLLWLIMYWEWLIIKYILG